MGDTSHLVMEQLVARVEESTRFDRKAIRLLESTIERVVAEGVSRQTVVFSTVRDGGVGAPPDASDRVAGPGALERWESERLAAERSALPRRLEQWKREAERETRVSYELKVSDCLSAPVAAVCSVSCHACSGRGNVSCGACGGQGSWTCRECGGTCRVRCHACNFGQTTCWRCGGGGRRNAEINFGRGLESVVVSCDTCGGSGRMSCSVCPGSGWITCRACDSSGQQHCQRCGAQGRQRCDSCDATGMQWHRVTLRCVITPSFGVAVDTEDREIRARVLRAGNFRELVDLGRPQGSREAMGPDHFEQALQVAVDLTRVKVRVHGTTVTVVGYGATATVDDYKNLIGTLLEQDVVELEQRLKDARPVGLPEAVAHALGRVLESEANERLAADAAPTTRTPRSTAVSAAYARRTVAAVRTAISRCARGIGLLGLLATAAATVGASVAAGRLVVEAEKRGAALALAALAGAAAWAAVEFRGVRRFRGRFDAPIAMRAERLLRQGELRYWRAAALVAAICLAVGRLFVKA